MIAAKTRYYLPLAASLLMAVTGIALLSINLYGLFADIRKDDLGQEEPELLRFAGDVPLSYRESLAKLGDIQQLDGLEYALEANQLVQQSLSHIHWHRVDPIEYRQLIPVWENYFLYFTGLFSNLPQFERYHFVDYRRSLERGIGICGDASMVLSQMLDKKGIENRIVSYGGHVITEVTLGDNQKLLLDPDFGVNLDMSLADLQARPADAYLPYIEAGYKEKEALALVRIYTTRHTTYDSVYAFMPRRYLFEYGSYILKWLVPAFLLLVSFIYLRHRARVSARKDTP